jgi:hypothetical protein
MRTTLNLDKDAAEILKDYAAVKNLSLGGAASDLVRKGIAAPLRVRLVDGLYVADLPPDSPVVTAEHVRRLMDEEF